MSTPTRNLFPPGHFYSPIPALADLERDRARIFGAPPRELAGIELEDAAQVALMQRFATEFYPDMPFDEKPAEGRRYGFANTAYAHTDAIFLHCMIRHARPRRIVEVGSGHSSCVTLDTNELFFGNAIDCTFIEPYPRLLNSLLKPGDADRIEVIGERVQDVDASVFDALQANDILFIDSTHVSKTGSDVNFLFFEVLPRLKSGVFVHFHDIFYPFEYPERWAMQGRAWNEAYLLRAFLQYNRQFSIVLFANYLVTFHRKALLAAMPKCAGNFGGNIWLRRS